MFFNQKIDTRSLEQIENEMIEVDYDNATKVLESTMDFCEYQQDIYSTDIMLECMQLEGTLTDDIVTESVSEKISVGLKKLNELIEKIKKFIVDKCKLMTDFVNKLFKSHPKNKENNNQNKDESEADDKIQKNPLLIEEPKEIEGKEWIVGALMQVPDLYKLVKISESTGKENRDNYIKFISDTVKTWQTNYIICQKTRTDWQIYYGGSNKVEQISKDLPIFINKLNKIYTNEIAKLEKISKGQFKEDATLADIKAVYSRLNTLQELFNLHMSELKLFAKSIKEIL